MVSIICIFIRSPSPLPMAAVSPEFQLRFVVVSFSHCLFFVLTSWCFKVSLVLTNLDIIALSMQGLLSDTSFNNCRNMNIFFWIGGHRWCFFALLACRKREYWEKSALLSLFIFSIFLSHLKYINSFYILLITTKPL